MLRRSGTVGCHVDLAAIGFGIGNELGDIIDRKRIAHLHHRGHMRDAGDGHDIAQEIVVELVLVQGRVHGIGRIDEQQRVSVRIGFRHVLRGDIAAGAGAVIDDELLAETFG